MLPPLPSNPVGGGEVTHLAVGFLGDAGPVTIWVVVLTFVFLECASILGLFLPGDSLLFAAGYAATGAKMSRPWNVALTVGRQKRGSLTRMTRSGCDWPSASSAQQPLSGTSRRWPPTLTNSTLRSLPTSGSTTTTCRVLGGKY